MGKFITTALLLTGLMVFLPVETQAVVSQPSFDSWQELSPIEPTHTAAAARAPIFPQTPEYIVIIVEINGELYGLIRDYDPLHASWLSRDPIGERGGVNLKGFCNGDSLNYIDPYGLVFERQYGANGNLMISRNQVGDMFIYKKVNGEWKLRHKIRGKDIRESVAKAAGQGSVAGLHIMGNAVTFGISDRIAKKHGVDTTTLYKGKGYGFSAATTSARIGRGAALAAGGLAVGGALAPAGSLARAAAMESVTALGIKGTVSILAPGIAAGTIGTISQNLGEGSSGAEWIGDFADAFGAGQFSSSMAHVLPGSHFVESALTSAGTAGIVGLESEDTLGEVAVDTVIAGAGGYLLGGVRLKFGDVPVTTASDVLHTTAGITAREVRRWVSKTRRDIEEAEWRVHERFHELPE